jgi:drug/metabolite transporter (DMT)-like permease
MTSKGWLLFAAISLIWGIPYLFIKIAVRELDPVVVVCARAAIGAAVLVPLVASQQSLRPLFRHWRALVVFALIHMAGSFVLISYGEQRIPSSLASLLISVNPLLVALLALGFMKSERINGPRLMGLLVGMLGLVVLLGFDVGNNGQQLLGVAFILLAALGYAIGALLLRRSPLAELPRTAIAAAECTTTTLVLLPLTLSRFPSRVPSADVIASLLVLGLICTALALPIFFALIKEVGASRGTVVTYVNPAVSVLLGVIVLHEPLTIAIAAGFLLIIAGSWLSTTGAIPLRFARQAAKPEVPA